MKLYLQKAKVANAAKWLHLLDQDRLELEYWLPHLKQIKTVEDAQQHIQKSSPSDFYLGEVIYEIWTSKDLVGLISLHSGRLSDNSVAMAYWLGKSFRSKGYSSIACQQLISKTFAQTTIQAMYIKCLYSNKASQALASSLNFIVSQSKDGILSWKMYRDRWLELHYNNKHLWSFLEEINLPN